jgi:hypothetical protein
MRADFGGVVLAVLSFTAPQAAAQTVDEEFKQLGEDAIEIIDHTRDACDKDDLVRITSTTDGSVTLRPGQVRYFRIRDIDDYTRSGGWYWRCGGSEERARIKGANYIKSIRKANGVIDWYKVRKKASAGPATASAACLSSSAPAGYGRYCSLLYPGGGWAFSAVADGNADPCGDMLKSSPGGTIARAGLWSISEENNVMVRCDGDLGLLRDVGSKATGTAFNNSKGKKNCVFTVSPVNLPVFGFPYGRTTAVQLHPSEDVDVTNVHNYNVIGAGMSVADFGQTPVANHPQAHTVDRLGRQLCRLGTRQECCPDPKDKDNCKPAGCHINPSHGGYDWVMPLGKPMLAVADGVVKMARSRDVSEFKCGDTDNEKFQNEIFIEHAVGSGRYAERFITYYAHMSRLNVRTGDQVKRGQKIGEAGDTGCSSASHLHFGVVRLTNTSGFRTYPYQVTPSGCGDNGAPVVIDPFGWAAPKNIDPWASRYLGRQNMGCVGDVIDPGAFSIDLWCEGQSPPNRR